MLLSTCTPSWLPSLDALLQAVAVLLTTIAASRATRARTTSEAALQMLWSLPEFDRRSSPGPGHSASRQGVRDRRKSSMKGTTST